MIDISVSLYFRIRNSDWFGGEGSIGYSKVAFEHVQNPDAIDDAFLEQQQNAAAKLCHVDPADVEAIPWDEYEQEMADDDGGMNDEEA